MKLAKLIASGVSVSWNVVLVRLLAAAAAPPACQSECDHAGAGSSMSWVDLDQIYGASGGPIAARAFNADTPVASFDRTPYTLPPQPVSGFCGDGCRRSGLSATEAPCPDVWVGQVPRVDIAPVPAGVPVGTSDAPEAIVACVRVTASGRAEEAYLVRNEATGAWGRVLPLAIRNGWLFEPARREGQAVAAWARVRVNPDLPVPPGRDARLAPWSSSPGSAADLQ